MSMIFVGTVNVFAIQNSATPSTNDINKTKEWAYVDVTPGVGKITLNFIQPRNFTVCFEYRTDGDLSQSIGTNYNSSISDGLYPYKCLYGAGSFEKAINARGYIEVRMVFGGERDERFDWTRFNVLDTSTTQFVGSPKYVRANNGGDLSAQVVTPDETSNIPFIINGNLSSPINGINVGGAGATTSWWRLYTPLLAGEHTISAEIQLNGGWYPISSTGITYSLDLPWAQYVIPQQNQYFRANDKVIRVKADDQFNQFNYMKTTINGIAHIVNRSNCSDQGSFVLCDLQNLNLPEGNYTASTTTYTMANNRADNLISQPFIIDNTRPTLSGFKIIDTRSVYSKSITVSAEATDLNSIDNVTYYITAPRSSDGICDSNGLKLSAEQGIFNSGTTYISTLDASGLNGDYCLNAIAEDVAANHSSISRIKVSIDNTAPSTPTNGQPNNSYKNTNEFDFTWSASTDNLSGPVIYEYQATQNPTHVDGVLTIGLWKSPNPLTSPMIHSSGADDGVWYWQVRSIDNAGNKSVWSPIRKITKDTVSPVVKSNSPSEDSRVNGIVTVSGDVTEMNPYRYYLVVKDSKGKVVAGPGTVYKANVADWNWDTTKQVDGTYTINLEARDAADNKNANSIYIIKVTVDNTPPEVTLNGYGQVGNTIKPYLVVNDDSTPLSYNWTTLVPDTDVSISDSTQADPIFTVYKDGTYQFDLIVNDALGNFSEIQTLTFTYTAPAMIKPVIIPDEADVAESNTAADTTTTIATNSQTTTTGTNTEEGEGDVAYNTQGEVLGEQTTTNTDTDSDKPEVKGVAVINKEDNKSWYNTEFIGVAWYWWLAVAAGVGGLSWWAIGAMRTRD